MSEKQKRFSKMEDGTAYVEQFILDRSAGNKWYIGMDFDPYANKTSSDGGTRRVPMSRIALLTDTGLVPASMLPGTVTTMVTGNMEYDPATKEWEFTTTDKSTKYCCPKKQDGYETPSEGVVYVDNDPENEDYYQYMFVPAVSPSDDNVGVFYCLPSPYMLVDGTATHIHDDDDTYTRSINLRTASKDAMASEFTGTGSIQVIDEVDSSNVTHSVLAHVNYWDTKPVTIGLNGAQSPSFGGTFKVPYMTVDESGHVMKTGTGTSQVTVPDTPATSSTPGLVVIGTDAPSSIGTKASAGGKSVTISGKTYFEVSPVDHVHKAYALTIKNDGTGDTHTYNGSGPLTLDMNDLVGATLPANSPTADSVMVYDGTKIVWTPAKDVVSTNYACVNGSDVSTGSSTGAYVSFGAFSGSDTLGLLGVESGEAIGGLVSGHMYRVDYMFSMVNSDLQYYYEPVDFRISKYSNLGTYYPVATRTYEVDASRADRQYVSGSATFMSDTTSIIPLLVSTGDSSTSKFIEHGTWVIRLDRFQIVEVK